MEPDCISTEDKPPNNKYSGYDTKQSDGGVLVMLDVWLVSLFNGISTLSRLFNDKAILLEEQ